MASIVTPGDAAVGHAIEPDGSIVFASDNAHPDAPTRAFRLVALLKWFPLDAAATQTGTQS